MPNIISREAAEEHKGALSLNYEGIERGRKEGGKGEKEGEKVGRRAEGWEVKEDRWGANKRSNEVKR